MANVLFIGKYPPIQGGTATAAYWRKRELEKRGIQFEVVTSIPISSEYYINCNRIDDHVHVLSQKTPWHIPYSQLISEQLISKALEIAEKQRIDIVEGNYLFPYGFASYVVSKILDKPLILRHAGSDLYRVADNNMFLTLLKEMAAYAKVIVTNSDSKGKWESIYKDSNTIVSSRYVPNPAIFGKPGKHSQVTFLGKVTEKWDRSQLDFYYDYLSKAKYIGKISVYSNDETINVFKKFFADKSYEVVGNPFVMPDEVPNILSDTKYLLISSIPSGIPEESNVYLEGITAGCIPVCMDNKSAIKSDMDFLEYIGEQIHIYEEVMS